MISIDQMEALLDALACELPPVFFEQLNGGILLKPDTVLSPESLNDDLYILGRYICSPSMGRYIEIYYGSFAALYARAPRQTLERELRRVLRHEFTHHLESLAGERALEHKDARALEQYRSRRRERPRAAQDAARVVKVKLKKGRVSCTTESRKSRRTKS